MSIVQSAGQQGAEIAGMLDGGMLFTAAAEVWSGEQVHTEIIQRTGRDALRPEEHHLLQTWRDDTAACCRREGVIRTASGLKVAEVSALFLPGRIADRSVIEQLQCTDTPLGRALSVLEVRRETLGTRMLERGPFAIIASGLLLLPESRGGLPVALAREQVYREFTLPC
jgi:hypothetical protein